MNPAGGDMPEFKIVVSDPEARNPRPILVKVVGSEELKYTSEMKEGRDFPKGKINPETLKLIKTPYNIVTLRIWKDKAKGEKINFTIRLEPDQNVPEFTLQVPAALIAEKIGEEESILGEVFRSKTFQVVVSGEKARTFIGKRIGDTVDASVVGIGGKLLLITGGTDNSGFPMVSTLPGTGKKAVLLSGPPGFHPRNKGERRRKYIRGNIISEEIVQINTKLIVPKKAA